MGAGRLNRRLRIGVPAIQAALPPHSAGARIWSSVLSRLEREAEVMLVDHPQPRRRLARRTVDVWMTDGHRGPLPVREPVVAHLHEASWADPTLRGLFDPAFVGRFEGLSAAAASVAARIITLSASSKRQVLAAYGLPADRVVVAPCGVDHDVYRPDLAGGPALVEAAGGDPSVPYVLFVSTVHPRKNLVALREAVAGLVRRGVVCGLVLVARPAPDRLDSSALVEAAIAPIPGAPPVVNLAGVDDPDLAALMAGAAAFCMPSLMEGFGMAVPEAMACGAPVVVSDRGALPEVAGSAAVVVAPESAAIEEGLASILTDAERAAALRAAGIERAQQFRWENTAATWLRVLREASATPA